MAVLAQVGPHQNAISAIKVSDTPPSPVASRTLRSVLSGNYCRWPSGPEKILMAPPHQPGGSAAWSRGSRRGLAPGTLLDFFIPDDTVEEPLRD